MAHTIEEAHTHSTRHFENDLFATYQAHTDVFFSSAKHQMVVKPPFANLLPSAKTDKGAASITERVTQSLRFAEELGLQQATVVGAIAFDVNEEPCLRLSSHVAQRRIRKEDKKSSQSLTIGRCQLRDVPPKSVFLAALGRAKELFAEGTLDKVVLSRAVDVECEHAPDIKTLVHNLEAKNPKAYTFAIPLANASDSAEPGATLIGASPELLLSKTGSRIVANPLAGSEPRSDDEHLDRQRAERLLQSSKDRYEHDLVIKAIEKALRPYCRWLHVPKQPSLVRTPTMWHLATRIEGELVDASVSSIALALALHPTPAVGGHPQAAAQRAIAALEGYPRQLFTGMVGWCNSAGDGEWAVTIRCAQVQYKRIRLYAGAGIVADSLAEKELAETEAKLNTLRQAIGVGDACADSVEAANAS